MHKAMIVAASALLLATSAYAGECPGESVGVGFHLDGPTESAGVAGETLISYDLDEHYDIAGRALRMRRLTVAPGGVLALHEHSDRPGAAFIVSGAMTEYRDTCAAPIVYTAGETVAENGPLAHWWRNESDAPAVIITADLPAD